ncbi:cytidylyltransferase domain-containing protein [Treponema primitia]|uniref:cytidylyltransferase domain-containing protein n=1 Tax=Treponema primitia TaxID=88058 RepID=UPI0002554C89|nr:NTP transferase domain-containing protein [Treponema primitia]
MTALILQGRLDSSRLPNKALLPLGEKPMLLRVMEAAKMIPADLHILACPDDSLAAFGPLVGSAGFELMGGPKFDVLRRYCIAIRHYSVDWVIRATGDNPFVFADAASALLRETQAMGADYAGYAALPYGAGVEVVRARALLQAGEEASSEAEREHVCPFLYNHSERFLLHRPLAPRIWQGPEIRLTVDTAEDYARSQQLYCALSPLSMDERSNGETIISVFRKTFQNSNSVSVTDTILKVTPR